MTTISGKLGDHQLRITAPPAEPPAFSEVAISVDGAALPSLTPSEAWKLALWLLSASTEANGGIEPGVLPSNGSRNA
jgi:hypothetical protein